MPALPAMCELAKTFSEWARRMQGIPEHRPDDFRVHIGHDGFDRLPDDRRNDARFVHDGQRCVCPDYAVRRTLRGDARSTARDRYARLVGTRYRHEATRLLSTQRILWLATDQTTSAILRDYESPAALRCLL